VVIRFGSRTFLKEFYHCDIGTGLRFLMGSSTVLKICRLADFGLNELKLPGLRFALSECFYSTAV